MKVVHCECCARQVVSYKCSDKYIVGPLRASREMVEGVCCSDCDELDKNGLFPEERCQAETPTFKGQPRMLTEKEICDLKNEFKKAYKDFKNLSIEKI